MRPRAKMISFLALGLALGGSASASPPSEPLRRLLARKKQANRALAESQARIDANSEQTRSMLEEYRAVQESLIAVRAQNAQLQRSLNEQRQELVSLDQQVAQVAKVRLELRPMLARMVKALDDFVALDLPFLPKERRARSQALHALLDSGKAPVATQARRIFEAYMVEMAYGQSLEAYEDQIELDDEIVAVQLLRVGRVGLYYLSMDGERAGYYDQPKQRFVSLDADMVPGIQQAILVAQKRLPPQLITVPVTKTPKVASKGARS